MLTDVSKYWPKRFTIYGLCCIAAMIGYLDRISISVASITMQQFFGWTDTDKGAVLSAFFVGYLGMQVVGGWLANRYGGRRVLAIAVLLWSVFTALTPVAAFVSLSLLIGIRVALGLAEGPASPSVFNILNQWAPYVERTRAVAIYTSGQTLGAVFGLSITGWFIAKWGWQAMFYASGAVGIVWVLVWLWRIPAGSSTTTSLGHEDSSGIKAAPPYESGRGNSHIPWKRILFSRPVWALIVTSFCVNWTNLIFVAWLPSYFTDAQGVSLTKSGLYSAAPWLTMFAFTNVSAWISDGMIGRGVSVTVVRKLMQSIGLLGSAACLLLIPLADSANEALIIICSATGLLAFSWSGCIPNPLDIAPKYADVLIGINYTFAMIPGIVGIYVTGWLVDTYDSYAPAFLLAAIISVAGTVVWLMYGTGKKIIN